MNNNVKKILKKEMRETLRDKKSLLMMLVIPFLIPLVIIGFSAFLDASTNVDVVKYNRIGFNYQLTEEEKIIVKELKIEPTVIEDTKKLKEAYNNDELDLYITKKDNIYTINGVNNETTTHASVLAKSYFEAYKLYLQSNYLENNNINSMEFMNMIVLEENILEEEAFAVTYMLGYTFMFIIMAITVAATYPSTDTTAGEKERGTLETLLTFPIKSRDIIVGKFLNVSLSSIVTGILSLILSLISFVVVNNMFTIYEVDKLQLSLLGLLFSIVVIVTYSFLLSGLCIAIATKSKSFKEAQSSLTPLTMICLFPGLIVNMVDIESNFVTTLIPFLNFTLLFNDIAAGKVNFLYIILMLVSTIIVIVLVFKIIIKQYKSEKVLF